tara:strand:+ start:145 stop:309 length:165 start_codon:yes stop_codon:yes gene_type:complete
MVIADIRKLPRVTLAPVGCSAQWRDMKPIPAGRFVDSYDFPDNVREAYANHDLQ